MINPENVRIVMINTSDSGNVGAAARAMKTMGFSRLYLVDPLDYPSGKATARASGASDVLHHAVVCSDFDEAVADCQLVVGTSARMRSIPIPVMAPREFGQMLQVEPDQSEVAIVFGRENSGLNNDELRRCNYHISIPGNPEYSVLNVAAAVQVLCYELSLALTSKQASDPQAAPHMQVSATEWDAPISTKEEMDLFLEHFKQTLLDIRFYDPATPRQILTRLRRLYTRTRLDRLEMNLMRGVLSRVQQLAVEADAKTEPSKRVQNSDEG